MTNTGSDMESNTDNISLLLVDDDELCRDAIKTILEEYGVSVTAVVDAEQAVNMIKATEYDAVVTDIMLPGMSGVDFLNEIRKTNQDLPVILITGHSSIGTATEAIKLGAQDYILKPLDDCNKLLNSIRQAVKHYRLTIHNRLLQEQLARSENTFRTLFHNANDIIFLHSIKDGNVTCTEVNEAACRRLGRERDELLDMSLLDITVEKHRAVMTRILNGLSDEKRVTFDTFYETADGSTLPVEVSAHIFDLENSRVVLSIARDVSGRRELEKKIAEASENERRRLGNELHDVLCQDLSTISMLSSLLKKTLDATSPSLQADVSMVQLLSSRSLAFTRQLCSGLFPVELERDGLRTALENLAHTQENLFDIPCYFESDADVKIEDKPAELNIFRIAQEAVSNSVKHSGAGHISISLKGRPDNGGILTITDDGNGFNADAGRNGGFGLHIMKYRAKIIGAALDISMPEKGSKGTKVTCSW